MLYNSTGVSLNICIIFFRHVHFQQAPIYAICSLQIWSDKNLQTSFVKWFCIKNITPPCMRQPFANIAASFQNSVALFPNFKENPPMYALNDFKNYNFVSENVKCCFARFNHALNYYSIVLKRAPSCWHIDWNTSFTFKTADSCLQSAQLYGEEV